MKFLARLVTGQIALWRTFWLIGVPLALVWDVSGLGMMLGAGIGAPVIAGSVIGLFTLACAAIPVVSVAIWRSAANYPRKAWWQTPLAWAAKACAAFSGLAATLSLLAVLYLAFDFIHAAFVPD